MQAYKNILYRTASVEMCTKKILVVDGDDTVRQVLANRLNRLGYSVLLASNGKVALNLFNEEHPDLIVLDIILSKQDGYEVCHKIRENCQTPIIILTALSGITDRVRALELGADDYVTKPFSPKELEARVQAVLRRSAGLAQPRSTAQQNKLTIGDLVIDITNQEVLKNNLKIKLTEIEFNILELLVHNAGASLTRATIMDNVWGYTPERYTDTRVVDVHIFRLRSKLEKNSKKPDLILTIRGIGYMFQKYSIV